jgi:hypothetical protein
MRPRDREPEAKSLVVAVVSKNHETHEGLRTYLETAGVDARCLSDVTTCTRDAPAGAVAFVVFPDDFEWEPVAKAIRELLDRRAKALPVVVTAHPKRFDVFGRTSRILVVPRPAWGWTIVDAVRVHAESLAGKRR